MDDITFRRTIYADPFTQDPEIIEAAKNDPKKQAFWEEVRAMETAIHSAMDIPVPDDLADKLILRQTMKTHQQNKRKSPWYIALAASLLLTSALTVGILTSSSGSLIGDVYAHIEHMDYESNKGAKVDLLSINNKLASYNGQLQDGMGEILSANYCYLNSIKSLHLIVKGENGLASLFVLPSQVAKDVDEQFANDKYTGKAFLLESAKIIIVGEDGQQVDDLAQRAKQLLNFSV
uniref:DUF3379 family protein n=1 Tax=Ningiella ruwaisensis TaxID=2364274 RepID=UPI0010A015E2|nr:DUF3379 family protein [Ningiella ruwaisensis]